MSDTFKGIITADGKKRQLSYGSVLETPTSDATLSKDGGFADAKAVGEKFAKVDEATDSLKEEIGDIASTIGVNSTESATIEKGGGIYRPNVILVNGKYDVTLISKNSESAIFYAIVRNNGTPEYHDILQSGTTFTLNITSDITDFYWINMETFPIDIEFNIKKNGKFENIQSEILDVKKKIGYSVTESATIASGGTYTPNTINLVKGNRYKITLLKKTLSGAIFYTYTINDIVSYVPIQTEGTSFTVDVVDGMSFWAWNNQDSAPATISYSVEKLPIYKEVSTYDIILPAKCKIASGRQLTIYAQNILDGTNPQNCQMMEYAWYNKHKDFVDFTPTDDNGSYSAGSVKIYLDDYITPTFEKPMAYDVIPSVAGAGKTKKCLFIGDSFTDMAQYIDELVTLFSDDGMNIELLGTRGTEGRKHEGRSGWNATDYCTKKEYLDMENPFFHNNAFDFSYYMQNNGYSGVDYVFVCLGANDNKETLESNLTYYNQIINSIKSYDSNIRIGIWTPCGGYQTYEGNMEQIIGIKIVDKFLIKNFDNRESEKIYIIPTHMIVHPLYDYPYTEEGISARNSNFKQLKITDCVHPSRIGMNKIADMIYSYIKYFGSLTS